VFYGNQRQYIDEIYPRNPNNRVKKQCFALSVSNFIENKFKNPCLEEISTSWKVGRGFDHFSVIPNLKSHCHSLGHMLRKMAVEQPVA
jgi:hypothetical protein